MEEVSLEEMLRTTRQQSDRLACFPAGFRVVPPSTESCGFTQTGLLHKGSFFALSGSPFCARRSEEEERKLLVMH